MATTRIKDLSKTATTVASDANIVIDGSSNGTQKITRDNFRQDTADAYVAAPSTYKLAPLNGVNKIDGTYLPTSGDTPKGEWNASTNSPTLADGTGTAGDYYDVTTAGTANLGSGAITYTVGDVVKYNGATWFKIDSVANILDGAATAEQGRTTLDVNSTAQDAEAIGTKLLGPSVYFDGTNDVVTVADDSRFTFSDGSDDLPFTISGWVNVASNVKNFTLFAAWDSFREFVSYIDTNGKVTLGLSDGTNDTYAVGSTVIPTDQWTHVSIRYSGAGPNSANGFNANQNGTTIFVNGVAETVTPINSASYGGLVNRVQVHTIGSSGTSFAKGHIRNVQIFNRELTASEVADLARGNELGFADQFGGALGGVYTQDATPSGEWSGSAGTDADEAGPVGGRSNILKFTNDGTLGQHLVENTSIGTTVGKRYRVEFYYYIPSTNSNIDGLDVNNRVTLGKVGTVASATLDAWTKFSGEYVATNNQLGINALDGGASSYQDAGADDVFYIDGLTVTEIGTLADFRSERFDASTGKWYDLSDNAFVGTNSGATLVGREVPIYETGTFTPTVEFGGASSGTYSVQEAGYRRIGNTVSVWGQINHTSKSAATGSATIEGLPFSSAASSNTPFAGVVGMFNAANLTSQVVCLIVGSSTSLGMYDNGATGTTALDDTNFGSGTIIRFSITYQIS